MFTGIIESMAELVDIHPIKENIQFTFASKIAPELKVDQSISHNGVCLTVEEISDSDYMVTAVKETLEISNLEDLQIGDLVNLERSMKIGGRLDGHIVQGHVDQVGACVKIIDENGSWRYDFEYEENRREFIVVEKGSITVNGVSLTAYDTGRGVFSVSIIPYTHQHTNFHNLSFGSKVNLEFDVIGKYVMKLLENRSD